MLSSEQKMNAGMWMVFAALSALGCYGAAKHSIAKDEDGKSHVQWTQTGIALLQAALVAGCTYMGAQAVRAR